MQAVYEDVCLSGVEGSVMKEYLGDAVYVERNEFDDLVLTTENGIQITNRVVLEPVVYRAFEDFVRRSKAR